MHEDFDSSSVPDGHTKTRSLLICAAGKSVLLRLKGHKARYPSAFSIMPTNSTHEVTFVHSVVSSSFGFTSPHKPVATAVGEKEGICDAVGMTETDGDADGDADGFIVGETEGMSDGIIVGNDDMDGHKEGVGVGPKEG
jgi:hypothetical protein